MSHRTILEFNHDYLHELRESPELQKRLIDKLWANDWWEETEVIRPVPGVRKIGERHHSETLKLTIT